MAEDKNQADERREDAATSEAQDEQEAAVVEAPVRDADNYVVQPTSYKLPVHMQVRGDMPDNRFTEEVLRGSDEDEGSGWDAHPRENQPVPGISGDEDELPDTTGRAANLKEKRER